MIRDGSFLRLKGYLFFPPLYAYYEWEKDGIYIGLEWDYPSTTVNPSASTAERMLLMSALPSI